MEELKDPGVRYGHHKIIKDKTLLHLPGTGEEQRFYLYWKMESIQIPVKH